MNELNSLLDDVIKEMKIIFRNDPAGKSIIVKKKGKKKKPVHYHKGSDKPCSMEH